MRTEATHGVGALLAFAGFACRYWLLAFPHARRAVQRCERAAAEIPDRSLRQAAVETLAEERGNLEGAAAFAAFTVSRHRRSVIETLVAFQAIFDYADTLAERAVPDPTANAHALHQALLVALTPRADQLGYYTHSRAGCDGGYMNGLVTRCQEAFAVLPSHLVVQGPLHRAVRRMIAYQTLIHDCGALAASSLAAWGERETPPESGLRWWETAAGGASSLVAFALIAAAAEPRLSVSQAQAIEHAYFPWIGALHVLLDSLIDRPHDLEAGHHSLVEHYPSSQETAVRMELIGTTAVRVTRALPRARQHALFLASMAGFYLAKPAAHLPHSVATTERLIATFGDLARPILLVHRTRQALAGRRGPAATW